MMIDTFKKESMNWFAGQHNLVEKKDE